jgi:hypothetical protein
MTPGGRLLGLSGHIGDWNHSRMAADEASHWPLSRATAGNSMAGATIAAKESYRGASGICWKH